MDPAQMISEVGAMEAIVAVLIVAMFAMWIYWLKQDIATLEKKLPKRQSVPTEQMQTARAVNGTRSPSESSDVQTWVLE